MVGYGGEKRDYNLKFWSKDNCTLYNCSLDLLRIVRTQDSWIYFDCMNISSKYILRNVTKNLTMKTYFLLKHIDNILSFIVLTMTSALRRV